MRTYPWQNDKAQHVIEQARKVLSANLGESEPPEIHTEIVYSSVVPTALRRLRNAAELAQILSTPTYFEQASALVHRLRWGRRCLVVASVSLMNRLRLTGAWLFTARSALWTS
jgi:hypothetical protein